MGWRKVVGPMKKHETIKVYIDFKDGETACICLRGKKKCNKPCTLDVVERDRFRGWEETMKRDRFGKCKF